MEDARIDEVVGRRRGAKAAGAVARALRLWATLKCCVPPYWPCCTSNLGTAAASTRGAAVWSLAFGGAPPAGPASDDSCSAVLDASARTRSIWPMICWYAASRLSMGPRLLSSKTLCSRPSSSLSSRDSVPPWPSKTMARWRRTARRWRPKVVRMPTISDTAAKGFGGSWPPLSISSSSTSSSSPWKRGAAPDGWTSSVATSTTRQAAPPSTDTYISPFASSPPSRISQTRPRAPTANSAGRSTTAKRCSPPGASARRSIRRYLGSSSQSFCREPAGKLRGPAWKRGNFAGTACKSTAAASAQTSRRCASYLEYPATRRSRAACAASTCSSAAPWVRGAGARHSGHTGFGRCRVRSVQTRQ
mmetsp:Transcript_17469/g.49588  ORF Transcript_17469/g.49588 Transcript_17469/m.49588 type:complete len:361 (-) Transcript_17469:219-1301(-)